MDNLFKYAKKELSQDAFLIWMISNADKKNADTIERSVALDFISFLLGKVITDVNTVELHPQWEHIDIVAEITAESGSKKYIFIEDKTTSNEHSNQLKTYSGKIEKKYAHSEIYKLFYKTDFIEDDERIRVGSSGGWHIVEMDEIASFWSKYVNCPNMIISMYSQRIMQINEALHTTSLPSINSDCEISMLAWKGYFKNAVIPKIHSKCNAYVVKTSYSYIALNVKPKGTGREDLIPYLEIRDRDCAERTFKSLVLTYGMSEKKERCKEFDKIIKINADLPDSVFKISRRNSTKQVLTMKSVSASDNDQFLDVLNKSIDCYLSIMNELT